MSQGSVIEVATWRGVGRPDSRTSRLMLGVGTGNVNEVDPASESAANVRVVPKPQGAKIALWYLQKYLYTIQKLELGKKLKGLANPISAKLNREKTAKSIAAVPSGSGDSVQKPAVTSAQPNRTTSADLEIEEWLNKITINASRKTARTSVKKASKPAPAKKAPAKSASKSTKRK